MLAAIAGLTGDEELCGKTEDFGFLNCIFFL